MRRIFGHTKGGPLDVALVQALVSTNYRPVRLRLTVVHQDAWLVKVYVAPSLGEAGERWPVTVHKVPA